MESLEGAITGSIIPGRLLSWGVAVRVGLWLLALGVGFNSASIASAAPIDPADVRIIDGDTIRVFHKEPNVRLVGFNAAETRRAHVLRSAS
jgi:endonuclease YncB( thermonuclease family)